MVLRSHFLECLRETLYKYALEQLEAVNAELLVTSLTACDWSGHIFGAITNPTSLTKKLAMSHPSTVHGGQHDTKYVAFTFSFACGVRG